MKSFLKYITPPLLLDLYFLFKIQKDKLFFPFFIKQNIQLKNKHKSQRCFILCSGPSIKKQDLRFLKDETVLALNNFYVHPDFEEIMSGSKEKYYLVAPIHPPQSEDEWLLWFSDMDNKTSDKINFIFGVSSYKKNTYNLFLKNKKLFKNKYNKFWYYSGRNFDRYNQPLAIDPSSPCVAAKTVSVYALMYAIYMGFEEIYLVGADHNQFLLTEKDVCFYKNAIHKENQMEHDFNKSSKNKMLFKSMAEIFAQYELLRKVHGKIFNLSPDSTIDVFPYKDIEKVKIVD